MINYWTVGFIYVLFAAAYNAQFDDIQKPGVNDDCARFCDVTYGLKDNSRETCKQGCSLFSVIQLTNDKANFTETDFRRECLKSCADTFKIDQLKLPCLSGCQNQTAKTGSIQIEMDSKNPFFNKISEISNNILAPAMDVFQDMRQRMSQMMQSMRQNMFGFPTEKDDNNDNEAPIWSKMLQNVQSMMNFDKFSKDPVFKNIQEQNPAQPRTMDSDKTPQGESKIGNSDEMGEPIIVVHMVPLKAIDPDDIFDRKTQISNLAGEDSTLGKDLPPPHEPSPPFIEISEDDWLSCVGRRIRHLSMITRWMLCLAMMLSVAAMIWICLAILHRSPKRRLHYLAPGTKGGLDNVYYTTPPHNASDKAPMIITTTGPDYTYEVKSPLEVPPPTYDVATKKEEEEMKKCSAT